MYYTVLDENLMVKGRLTLNNGNGSTAFFSDVITQQIATDNSNDPTSMTSVAFNELDKQGNAKQWNHALTINVESTDLGASISTKNYLMYLDDESDHYYLMKVLNTATDRNSGYIVISAINTAIYELGKLLTSKDTTYPKMDLKSLVSKVYQYAPFSIVIQDNLTTLLDYTISANTSLQATLQDIQTKYNVDVDSWVEVDAQGRITDRILYFGHLGQDNGELIRYGGAKGFENINAQEISDIIYTKLYITGVTNDKDPNKGHIGSVNNGLEYIVDDEANQLQNAIGASQLMPSYLEGSITNNILSEPLALLDWGKAQMALFNHPRYNYTVTPMHDQSVGIGDTITVQDFHVKPEILVTSKVIQKTTSFASPETNTFVLGEFSSIFTDNINKSANVITLIKKDVNVVQEAADIARAQADAAHQQAVAAQEAAIHAQTSADGKTTTFTLTSVEDLPKTANEGDSAWITLSDGTYHYVYLNGEWVKDISPNMGKEIAASVDQAVTKAQTYADQAIKTNQQNIDASIKSVDDKANQLKQDQSVLDTKAQGYANQAKADAIANTAEIEKQLRQSIADGDTGLQTQITSNKDAIVLTATKTELNDAKTDYNAQISSLNVKADGITQTVTQVSDKVDNLQVGGRNLLYKTAYLAYPYGANNATVTVEPYDSNTNMYHIVSNKTGAGIYFYQQDGNNIKNGEKWSFGIDVKGVGVPATIGVETHVGDIAQKGSVGPDWSRVSFMGTSSYDKSAIVIYFNPDNGIVDVYVKLPKLEIGNVPTTYTPAPEDTDSKFSQQQQTIDSINSTVQQQGTNINNVSTRVQTAEGEISTAQDNITGLQSSQKQTADGLSQEVSDRKSGDSTVLQQGKDFTTSQVSNSETNMKSLIDQKADSATIGVVQNDIGSLKGQVDWQELNNFDDMNYLGTGKYFITGGAHTNAPVQGWFYITVESPKTDRITQTAWQDQDNRLVYRRVFDGTKWSAWSQVVSSSTLLNIFHDSWSLGTSTNDGITKQMITGIMGQPDGTLILKGKSLILDGNTTVTGDFYAKGGNFDNLNASHIKFGTLDGYQVNIANVNVNNLVGDTITGFNFNVNKQMTIASGGIIQSDVINMDKDSFTVKAPNINSHRISSEGYTVFTRDGVFNIISGMGSFSSDGNISVASDGNTDPYKRGIFHSEYGGNNLMMSATGYTNSDPDEFLNMSSARLDYMYSKTGLLSDASQHTSIRANLIETTGTLNAFGVTQTPRVYSWPNLTLESIQQSVVLKAGNQNILQVRENSYVYLLTRHSGSGGSSLQIAGDGALFVQSSASKYKEDIKYDGSTAVGDKFLTLDPATWQDKDEYKQRKLYRETGIEPTHQVHMTDKRYYGLIAEDLVKAGLEEFVVRDEKTGEVNGLEYDKVAISLIPVVREQRNALNELKAEIERLKDKIQ